MLRIVLAIICLGAVSSHAAAAEYDCAYDPKASHLSRIVAADSTNGPIYGQALNDPADKSHQRTLNLQDHELVLSFDDGPLGANTQTVLATLQKHCVKAVFFSVGRMAQANPKLIQEVERRGHTVGTHTWSHPRGMDQLAVEDIKLEIEKGFAAVGRAVGKPIAPFFRFPGLRDSPAAIAYLAGRNISIWSVDVISGDTDPGANPERITKDVINRIRPRGKGIVLFHDIKKQTADALDGILTILEKDGYKFVQVVSNTNYQPDPELIARSDVFRNSPETATITGRWLASSKQQLKDGSVDVMHTEWIDLKLANEKLANQANSGTPIRAQSEAQHGAVHTANGWQVSGQVR
ncbi:MAG: polysaccharide deacetylase family protein [Rhodomicrobium sp.]|nr:polysaccharide deacetylase family protein [Rhodomicrobium sp.]